MKKNKGFTLIELMVVISIISLLSSIVLASVKEVRDRANMNKFRAEMNQFINALELYRNDNGKYPYEDSGVRVYSDKHLDNSEYVFPSTLNKLSVELEKYISKTPKPIQKNSGTDLSWKYQKNLNTSPPGIGNIQYRCENDTVNPSYVILVRNNVDNILNYNAVSDWERFRVATNEISGFSAPNGTYRCFSLK